MDNISFESVINGEKVKLKLRQENVDIERKCDTEYHIAFTELVQKGILPRASLEKIMSDRGIWTKEQQSELEGLQARLVELQTKLAAANTNGEGVSIANEMGDVRGECLKLVEVKSVIFSNSCESLAESIRRDAYIAYALVYEDTNKPVFKNYNDFLSRSEEQVVEDARKRTLEESIKVFQDSVSSLPELEYLTRIEAQTSADNDIEQEVNDSLQADEEEAEEQTATIKKTTRKKTTRKTAAKTSKKVS